MTIKPVDFGSNTFCGPAVISSITGITTDEAERLIQSLRDGSGSTKPVKAAYISEILEVLKQQGYKYLRMLSYGSLFMNLTQHKEAGVYIMMPPSHFIVLERTVSDWLICDNHTRRPISASSSARLSQKIVHIYRVWK